MLITARHVLDKAGAQDDGGLVDKGLKLEWSRYCMTSTLLQCCM